MRKKLSLGLLLLSPALCFAQQAVNLPGILGSALNSFISYCTGGIAVFVGLIMFAAAGLMMAFGEHGRGMKTFLGAVFGVGVAMSISALAGAIFGMTF